MKPTPSHVFMQVCHLLEMGPFLCQTSVMDFYYFKIHLRFRAIFKFLRSLHRLVVCTLRRSNCKDLNCLTSNLYKMSPSSAVYEWWKQPQNIQDLVQVITSVWKQISPIRKVAAILGWGFLTPALEPPRPLDWCSRLPGPSYQQGTHTICPLGMDVSGTLRTGQAG